MYNLLSIQTVFYIVNVNHGKQSDVKPEAWSVRVKMLNNPLALLF